MKLFTAVQHWVSCPGIFTIQIMRLQQMGKTASVGLWPSMTLKSSLVQRTVYLSSFWLGLGYFNTLPPDWEAFTPHPTIIVANQLRWLKAASAAFSSKWILQKPHWWLNTNTQTTFSEGLTHKVVSKDPYGKWLKYLFPNNKGETSTLVSEQKGILQIRCC